MKELLASTEIQYMSGKRAWCKIYVSRSDGSMIPGSRSLRSFNGATLRRKLAELQTEIDNGAWR